VPRVGLTRAQVAAVAADLADAHGLDALSLSAVAKQVGVSQPALYKHLSGIDELRRAVAALAVEELAGILHTARDGRRGRDALLATLIAYRSWATRHPGRAAAVVRAPEPDDADHLRAATAAVGELFAVLADYGLEGEDAIHAVRQLRACLHGFVTLEAAGGFGLPESVDETFRRMVDILDAGLRAAPASR
jgi:AcrR family transcriptional regulator